MSDDSPKLYGPLAGWFHLLTAPAEYEEEAATFTRVILAAAREPVKTVLELGGGGGNNAVHMKRHFELTLTDLSEEMLALSRTINPELEHIQGDMRTVRLERTFDAVFVQDAVCYMTTEDDVRAAIETAAVHCAPGGVALICPDFVRENFRAETSNGGHDGSDGRSLRYLGWVREPEPGGTTYNVDMAYLLQEVDGTMRVVHDRHVEGLFPRDTWLRLMREADFEAMATPFEHSDVDYAAELFVGVKRE